VVGSAKLITFLGLKRVPNRRIFCHNRKNLFLRSLSLWILLLLSLKE